MQNSCHGNEKYSLSIPYEQAMKIEAKNAVEEMNSHVIKYHRNARNCCLKLED